jgi:hypothetical protein
VASSSLFSSLDHFEWINNVCDYILRLESKAKTNDFFALSVSVTKILESRLRDLNVCSLYDFTASTLRIKYLDRCTMLSKKISRAL